MKPFHSRFSRTFDLVVFGTGYAAFGAVLRAREIGQSVCLVSRQSDLIWESGRAFMSDAGASDAPLWQAWMNELKARNAAQDHEIDGALAEVVGTDLIFRKGIEALYYSTPVDVQTVDDALESVTVATKGGYRRVVARQWIDATETGEVLGLLGTAPQLRMPSRRRLFAYYQHAAWPNLLPGEAASRLKPTLWPRQRRLEIDLPGDTVHPRRQVIPALRALFDAAGDAMSGSILSHCSLVDCPEYTAADPPSLDLPRNVGCAAPALSGLRVTTLADRFTLGVDMSDSLADAGVYEPPDGIHDRPVPDPSPTESRATDVLVAGAGTGGAYAAIAASREGAQVTVIEPYDFPGGIGAGGGIHWCYYGVPGGLQAEADRRTLDVMPLFGDRRNIRGFHPEARKLVLEAMFDEAGITFHKGALVCAAHRDNGNVDHVTVARAEGLMRIHASAFIDATGDGDLCVQAGAAATMGRQGDGLVHAYSQSGGRLGERDGHISADHMNFDAGFTDPADAEDLTRARIVGIRHYLQDTYSDASRWTYIAPAIGLRQSRQIVTDYAVTLADLVERRSFPDAVGYTGAHYDNHAVDYEFESDEGLFWVWHCRQWREGRTACEIPYRMILPKGLDNVWIACRAAGVTQDAHHSFRMQRDLQRLGEVAGIAASIGVAKARGSREIPFAELRDRLTASGALDLEKSEQTLDFGPTDGLSTLGELQDEPAVSDAQVEEGLEALRSGAPSRALWYLYRARDRVESEVVTALGSGDSRVSWLASGVLALWGDARAEHRLLSAIRSQESGFDDVDQAKSPERFRKVVPNWLTALSMVRCCGTRNVLPVLRDFAEQEAVTLNIRTGIALTLERLVDRGVLGRDDATTVRTILDALQTGDIPGGEDIPQRNVSVPPGTQPSSGPPGKTQSDFTWQLHLVVARICGKLGLSGPDEVDRHLGDERVLVRRAFERLAGDGGLEAEREEGHPA